MNALSKTVAGAADEALQFTLSVSSNGNYVSVGAPSFGELMARVAVMGASLSDIADRNRQFAALAESRNALAAQAAGEPLPAPKKGKPVKAEPEPVEEAAVPVEEQPASPEPDAPAVAYEDVRALVTKVATTKGRDAVIGVLTALGVDHASKLTEAQWGQALVLLDAALAA